jgi:hypothetical protein
MRHLKRPPKRPDSANLAVQTAAKRTRQRRARRPQPEAELVNEIKALIAGQPTYGYWRIHALLRRQRREQDGTAVNVKRVYRVSGRDIAPSDWSSKQAQEQERLMTEVCEENGSC